MKCPYCNAELDEQKRFCSGCGKYISAEIKTAMSKEKENEKSDTNDQVHEVKDAQDEDTQQEESSQFSETIIPDDSTSIADQADISSEEISTMFEENLSAEASISDSDITHAVKEQNDSNENAENTQEGSVFDDTDSDDTVVAPPILPVYASNSIDEHVIVPPVENEKPNKNSPWATVGTWGWIGIRLLLLIPVINIILLLIWSFGGTKKAVKQSFARATLVLVLISMILIIAAMLYLIYTPSLFDRIRAFVIGIN